MQDKSPQSKTKRNTGNRPSEPGLIKRLTAWAKRLKTDVEALSSAARDPRTPMAAKLVILFIVAYALSPIDLIPDFIPIIGYLDDLVILPLAVALAIRLIPNDILIEHRARLAAQPQTKTTSRTGAAIVIALWFASTALVVWWLYYNA